MDLDQTFLASMNLWRVRLGVVALLLLVILPAPSQQPTTDSVRLIKGDNPSRLEKELNEAAAEGYRISGANSERVLSVAANLLLSGGHHDTSGAFVVMEKSRTGSTNYQYAVVRLFARPSSWERDINKAASQGFRVIPNYGTLAMRNGFVLGTAQSLIAIMEKAPGSSAFKDYVVVDARQIADFEREVNLRFAAGYTMIYMGRFYALHVALMEKTNGPSAQERLLTAKKDEELEAKMRASATERFCAVQTESTLEDTSRGERLAHLKKCDTTPEYVFTENDEKQRTDFDKAVANGYRLVPTGVFGKAITLVKAPAGEHYEYRFVKSHAEADEARRNGYADVPLSYPIWHGFALERRVTAGTP
ncbi:MAG: hypothetical protein C5B58_06125 [Acidobacteria bacterium]|nr:MAG: hypothetical protein C5B58_06125 [Acidobacteriota bacterium]